MTIKFPNARRGSTYGPHDLVFSGTGTIADCVLRMMVKANATQSDAQALASIDNALLGGLVIVTATSPFKIRITITDTVMAALPPTTLVAGIQIELPDGTTHEIEDLDPRFLVKADIVRAVAAP